MKIAMVMFGQPRSIHTGEVFKSHQEWILNKYETDVYAHCWFNKNGSYEISSHARSGSKGYCPPNSEEIIRSTYNPKSLVIEETRTFKLRSDVHDIILQKFQNNLCYKNTEENIGNYLSQLYSIEAAARLVSDPKQYDLIVMCRYDIVIEYFPELSTLNSLNFHCMNHHPRFPDVFFIFGPSFLSSQFTSSCVENEIIANQHLIGDPNWFWEPSPESFKFFHYRLNYDTSLIRPIYIREHRVIEDLIPTNEQ